MDSTRPYSLKIGVFLIRGGDPVQRRQVLPFELPDDIEIALYAERPDLEAAWSAAMDGIENSDLMLEGRPVAQPKAE